jgi:hypothetical protein
MDTKPMRAEMIQAYIAQLRASLSGVDTRTRLRSACASFLGEFWLRSYCYRWTRDP